MIQTIKEKMKKISVFFKKGIKYVPSPADIKTEMHRWRLAAPIRNGLRSDISTE